MKKLFYSRILLLAGFSNCQPARLLLLLMLAGGLSTTNCFSQTPNYLWAKREGGTSQDYGQSCTTDAGGNIIATGVFYSPSLTFGTTTLTNTNVGYVDFFIVKYDPSGNVLWAKSAGGTGNDYGYSCSTDASGNIIATGYFLSPSITFGTTTLTNASGGDIFIVKYDPSGNVLWAKSAGGTNYDYGQSCSVDASGNIIATGYFSSPILSFGTTTLTNASAGVADIFIVKYDPSGNVLWAKSAGGTNSDAGYSCSVDASGNIIATGDFWSSSITFGTITLTNAGTTNSADIFIVKYDPSGNVLWAKSAGGTYNDFGQSCSTDASGNIIATSAFRSPSITFGTTTLTNADVTGNTLDLFIVKYDPSGNVLWAKSEGGTNNDYGYSCTADAGGNIIATGGFQSSTLSFGTIMLTNASAGGYDIFIVKLDGLTGIEENNFETGVSVFPNPSSGVFWVSIPSEQIQPAVGSSSEYKIELYNVYGEKIQQLVTNRPITIDLSAEANGIYFIKLISEKGTDSYREETKKIIINQ